MMRMPIVVQFQKEINDHYNRVHPKAERVLFTILGTNKKERLRGVICKHENCGKFITPIQVLSSKQRRCN